MGKYKLMNLDIEVEMFLRKVNIAVNGNVDFMNAVNREIEFILANKGNINVRDDKLFGSYRSQLGIKIILGNICENMVVSLIDENGYPSVVINNPENSYVNDDPQSITYGKKVTDSYISEMNYFEREDGSSEIIELTKKVQLTNMTPEIQLISNKSVETISEYGFDNKNTSFVEIIKLKEGYTDRSGVFFPYGHDLREKIVTSVNMTDKYFVKRVETFNNNDIESYYKIALDGIATPRLAKLFLKKENKITPLEYEYLNIDSLNKKKPYMKVRIVGDNL